MADEVEILKHLYDRFNARDLENLLHAMDPEVVWANGMDGGHVHRREGVRDYWMRQWAAVNPTVVPVAFLQPSDGQVIVDVHQVVHDLEGTVLLDRMVRHQFQIMNGLIQRFDIRDQDVPHDRV